MEKFAMKEVPVKIEVEDSWVVSKIGIGEDRIHIFEPVNREILLKSIVDLEERKNTLRIETKGTPPVVYKVASVPKVLAALKRIIIMSCTAYRLMAYFKSPAVRGGVLVKDAAWEKGAIAVLKTGIWFVSPKKQICIPLEDVSDIELTKREVNAKKTDVVKIDHVEGGGVSTSYVLCPLTTLQVLYNFLKEATKEMDMQGDELDPVSAQVSMLVYSGMDSNAIEKMLAISNDELETVFDTLLDLGIVEVVRTRREVQLTTKGVRFVTDAAKNPSN
jgi:helix-turn-helix protein